MVCMHMCIVCVCVCVCVRAGAHACTMTTECHIYCIMTMSIPSLHSCVHSFYFKLCAVTTVCYLWYWLGFVAPFGSVWVDVDKQGGIRDLLKPPHPLSSLYIIYTCSVYNHLVRQALIVGRWDANNLVVCPTMV